MATTTTTETLTAPDAAKRLGVPYRTLMNWLKDEDGPIQGQQDEGGQWMVRGPDVERLARERAVKGADALIWNAAAKLIRDDVVREREANKVRIAAVAARLASLKRDGPEFEEAEDDMREALAEAAALYGLGLGMAERIQAEAYRRARELAGRSTISN